MSSLDDKKLDRLSDSAFRAWTKLNCVATENGGVIPDDINDLVFRLRKPAGKVREWLQILLSAGLLERCDGGFIPHNWAERQFNSSVSTARVQAFRDRSKERSSAVSETADETLHETEMERPHSTETEKTEAEKKEPEVPKANAFGANGADSPSSTKPEWWPIRDRYGRVVGEVSEKVLFDVGKSVLGKSAGGIVSQARKAWSFRGSERDRTVMEFLLQADETSEPRPWFCAKLRKAEMDEAPNSPSEIYCDR